MRVLYCVPLDRNECYKVWYVRFRSAFARSSYITYQRARRPPRAQRDLAFAALWAAAAPPFFLCSTRRVQTNG